MNYINLDNGIFINSQVPLDPKGVAFTVAQLEDLGEDGSMPYKYYNGLTVFCVENGNFYAWVEVGTYSSSGLLVNNFTYPIGFVTPFFDYGGKSFNFYIVGGGSGSTFVNTASPPVTIGGYNAGEPATPSGGFDVQAAFDKLLFPAVQPTISNFTATPQPKYNQPVPFNVNINWNLQINSTGASIQTITLEWKRSNSSTWLNSDIQINADNLGGVHTINTIDNNNLSYRLTVVDTQGATRTSIITRTIENYQSPSVTIVKTPSANTIERGVLLGTTAGSNIVRNTQFALITGYTIQKRTNPKEDKSGVWSSWINLNSSAGTDLGTPVYINATGITNYNDENEAVTQYRVLVTDSGEANNDPFGLTETKKILPYFYGKSLNPISIGQGIFDTATKVVSTSLEDLSIIFNASAEYLWFATPVGSPTKTKWFITTLNSGDIQGTTNLWKDPSIISVISPDGLWTQDYKVYITNDPTSTANGLPIQFYNN